MQNSSQTSQTPQIIVAEPLKSGCPIAHSDLESPLTAVEGGGAQESIKDAITDESDAAERFSEFIAKDTE